MIVRMTAAPNRRNFLRLVAGTFASVRMAKWSVGRAASPSDIPKDRGPRIIDTHTHFYDPTRAQGVPWPPPDDKLLYRRVLPADFKSLKVPVPVAGTVVVEASPWIEDNQWILDLAAQEPLIVGFVGNLPIGKENFARLLERFAANPLFRGIRVTHQKLDQSREGLAVLSDLTRLAEHNLSLDLLGGLEILNFADQLAQKLPNLRIIIDHLAGLSVDGKAPPADWVRQMRALSQSPNVYFKVSGLVEGTGREDGTAPKDVEFYRPVLDVMGNLFGPRRLIYGSNWPVSERFAPLSVVQTVVAEYFSAFGRRAEEQVFSETARTAYRWITR